MKQEQIMNDSTLLLQQTAHTDNSDQQGSSLHQGGGDQVLNGFSPKAQQDNILCKYICKFTH